MVCDGTTVSLNRNSSSVIGFPPMVAVVAAPEGEEAANAILSSVSPLIEQPKPFVLLPIVPLAALDSDLASRVWDWVRLS